jgi:hypothetical protein
MERLRREIRETVGAQFYARGRHNMPSTLKIDGGDYEFIREFKHDFFAVTGLYQLKKSTKPHQNDLSEKVVLKISRQQNILGLPFEWFGQCICENEINNLKRLSDIKQVPKLICRWNKCGLIYEYIEGSNLSEVKQLPENFFDNLSSLLKELHKRRLVYLDMNKRNNILLGKDDKPHIIDFQVCIWIGKHFLISTKLSDLLHNWIAKKDLYHLYKHKRKLQPHLLSDKEHNLSYHNSKFIRMHRFVATPFRRLRRNFLNYLRRTGCLFRGKQQA